MSLTAKHVRAIMEYYKQHAHMPDYHAVGDAGEWLELAEEIRRSCEYGPTNDEKCELVHFLLCGVPVIPYDPADLP